MTDDEEEYRPLDWELVGQDAVDVACLNALCDEKATLIRGLRTLDDGLGRRVDTLFGNAVTTAAATGIRVGEAMQLLRCLQPHLTERHHDEVVRRLVRAVERRAGSWPEE